MSIADKVSSDVVVSTAINLSQKIRGLVIIPLITRLLGTASYGAFVQIEVVTRLCEGFFRLGLERALVRYVQACESKSEVADLYYSLTSLAVASGLIASIGIFLSAESISTLFLGSDTYVSLFQVGSVLVPIYVLQSMAQNYYRSEMRVKTYSLLEGIKTYLNVLSIATVLLVVNLDLLGVVTTVVVIEGAFAIVLQYAVVSSLGLRKPTFSNLGTHLRYAFPAMITDVFGMFQDRFDRILIGFYLGASAVGIYSVAYTVARLLRIYILPLRISFFAEFSRLWEAGDREQCYRFLADGSRYFLALSIPSVVGLYLIGHPFLTLLSTDEVATEATVLLPVLAAGLLFIGLETLYRQLFLAAEMTFLPAATRVGGTILNIGLNVALIPMVGVAGAALATLISYMVGFVVVFWPARRRFGVSFNTVFAAKAILAASIMAGLVLGSGINGLVPTLVISPVVYFAVLSLTKGIKKDEFRFVFRTIRSTVT